jgi:hypothetical protein
MQRRDPIGRAWHEGLLDGHGVDPEVLRDIGRQFGFLYWHEYRDRSTRPSAAIRTWWRSARCGCARRARHARRHVEGVIAASSTRWARRSADALDRLCVNDMWFAEGPDWLDRMINSERVSQMVARLQRI